MVNWYILCFWVLILETIYFLAIFMMIYGNYRPNGILANSWKMTKVLESSWIDTCLHWWWEQEWWSWFTRPWLKLFLSLCSWPCCSQKSLYTLDGWLRLNKPLKMLWGWLLFTSGISWKSLNFFRSNQLFSHSQAAMLGTPWLIHIHNPSSSGEISPIKLPQSPPTCHHTRLH